MAEGCSSNMVKYTLFFTNFLTFILGLAVVGCSIWVLVDKPNFMMLFEKAVENVPELADTLDVNLYSTAAYIIIFAASIVAFISFLGCFGALKESKCLLATYFVLVLILFVLTIIGAVMGYKGDFKNTLRDPLVQAMNKYNDGATAEDDPQAFAYKNIWNQVQSELQCCGINNVTDWRVGNHGFSGEYKQPEGCCHYKHQPDDTWSDIWGTDGNNAAVNECRTSDAEADDSVYKFEGCLTIFCDYIGGNQHILVSAALGVLALNFLNLLFSFAMCTMVD